ncbi:2-amino-4-hydroxy-6-hydroxymethyldihydropteridinediphosphokinase [Alphaproteobacteria bacterium]
MTHTQQYAYLLALGTNLGDRRRNLRKAMEGLSLLGCVVQCSFLYSSPALLPKNAPQTWDLEYFNVVSHIDSGLAPHQLLEEIKAIEANLGRDLDAPRWSPRIIDIDILLSCAHSYSGVGLVINDLPHLAIPHPEFLKRDFCLVPAVDIAPHLAHPVTQKTLKEHLLELSLSHGINVRKMIGSVVYD